MLNFLAKVISRVFGEVGIGFWFAIILFSLDNVSYQEAFKWLLINFLIVLFIPLSFLIIQIKRKRISDIDVTKREERYGIIFISLLSVLISLIISLKFDAPRIIIVSLIIFSLDFFFYLLITFFWKISGHALWITNLALFAAYFISWWWMFLFVPLVWWARLRLKKHTIWQVLAGSLLSLMVFIIIFILNWK